MTDSSCRQSRAVHEDAIEHEAHSIDADTRHDFISNDRPHYLDVHDQLGRQYRDSHSPEPAPHFPIRHGENYSSHRTHTPQNDTPLLSDHETDSSASLGTTEDQLTNSSQRPALDQSAQHLGPTWTEVYFRPLFLVPLATLLALMIVLLEVLNSISQQNQGLVTASEHMHYIWTYGPTFFLTMIATLWGQLELRAKQIMPWCLMSRGETPAQNGLMLNYVTSSTIGSLVRSLKRKHFLVSIGICGSLILRLMIIFASGLLRLEYRTLTVERPIRLEDVFDFNRIFEEDEGPVTTVFKYWGALKYGVPLPHGTTSQFAVQSFATTNYGEDDQLTGHIKVFESSLEECDPFKFTYDSGHPFLLPNLSLALVIPASMSEKLRPWCEAESGLSVLDVNFRYFVSGATTLVKCTDSSSLKDVDHRILLTSDYTLGSNESEISGSMCVPRYSLTRRAVTNRTQYVGHEDSLDIKGEIIETLEMGIPQALMTHIIVDTVVNDWRLSTSTNWTGWHAILNASQPQSDPAWSFRNTSLLIDVSKRTWKGLAAYVIKHDYTVPSRETIDGTSTSMRGRLCVQELSLRLVEAQITFLIALVVTLYFFRPGLLHRDPTSLGAHAMILARSPGLIDHLEGYGVESDKVLREYLAKHVASFSPRFLPESPAISLHHSRRLLGEMAEKPTVSNNDTHDWWLPMPVRCWFRAFLMTAILAVVITLEVLLRVSSRENGLGDINLDGYLKYTWGFLPTLVLVLLGLLFSMVDSTARILHPFQLLQNGRATLKDLLHDPARQVSLMAVLDAAWRRQFVLLSATLPGLLAPVLTIISSGLYTAALVPWTYDAELELKDWFRPEDRTVNDKFNWVDSDSREGSDIFILTQLSNIPYPQWTQGEYALASFGADNLHSHDGNDTSLCMTARIPAVHASLNCSLVGQYDDDAFLTDENFENFSWLSVDPDSLGCHTPLARDSTAEQRNLSLVIERSERVDTGEEGPSYYFSLLRDTDPSLDKTASYRVCGDGRQHYFIGFAYGLDAMSLLHCVPYVEALLVTLAFALPDLSVVADVPVEPDRGSAVFLSDSPSMTAFQVDKWQEIAISVVNGSSGAEFLRRLPSTEDSNSTSRLIGAVESTLAKYMAQNLHFNYRQPLAGRGNTSASPAGQTLIAPEVRPATGTVTDRTRVRLVQNAVSTRILQGMLTVMGACLIATTALGRGARVIPRDPGSIASRMAYFAGGEVWRRVPVGADRWTDKQISRYGLGTFDGRLLLDWWGGDNREDTEGGGRGKRFAVDSIGRKAVV